MIKKFKHFKLSNPIKVGLFLTYLLFITYICEEVGSAAENSLFFSVLIYLVFYPLFIILLSLLLYLPTKFDPYFRTVRNRVALSGLSLVLAGGIDFLLPDQLAYFSLIAFVGVLIFSIMLIIKHLQYKAYVLKKKSASHGVSKNIFAYFKEMSKECGIKANDGNSMLFMEFDKIVKIDTESILFDYLNKIFIKGTENKKAQPIFPFGFNASQKTATKNALSNKISVIEGPPGTGKTQTILNIIANAVMSNQSIAIVSNNNSATQNVFEKLDKYGLSFIVASLGNSENKTLFFDTIKTEYPDMNSWRINPLLKTFYKIYIYLSGLLLDFLLFCQIKSAQSKVVLSKLNTEEQYYQDYHSEIQTEEITFSPPQFISARDILKLCAHYQFAIDNGLPLGKGIFFRCLFWCASSPKKLFTHTPLAVTNHLQQLYYSRKEKELNSKIRFFDIFLNTFSYSKLSQSHQDKSMKLFKAALREKYRGEKRPFFDKNSYFEEYHQFMKEYPIVLSSTHSLKKCAPEGYLFDYVIVDEASQVDLVTGALVLSCAKNVVVVGDTQQLPNIMSGDLLRTAVSISDSFQIDDAYRYELHSFLSSISAVFPKVAKTMLREHYRCHPKIIDFCNQRFYDNNLIILSKDEGTSPIVLYETAFGNHERDRTNQRQLKVIMDEILPTLNLDKSKSIGVISPFRNQKELIQTAIHNRNIEVDTIHKFQGREKDIIILSTVSDKVNDFITKPDLLNVAVSRAKDKLIVVIAKDESFSEGNSIISELIRYIKYNNFEVVESQLYSIFDLLYSQYSDALIPLLKKAKRVSKFKSENIANAMIGEVLSEESFKHLSHVLHLPLKMLIQDTSLLTLQEATFVNHPNSHIDFMIFSKIDKRPVLAIEVDGYAFHAANPEQLQRDQKKDSILTKYGIPILRLSTVGSGEKQKLINLLTSF